MTSSASTTVRNKLSGAGSSSTEARQRQCIHNELDPLGEAQIGRDDGGAALVAVGDEIEEQLTDRALEADEAELVDDEHVDTEQALLESCQLAAIARFE